jgi:hypothetical protein
MRSVSSMTSFNLPETMNELSDGGAPHVQRHGGKETWVHTGNPR